VSQTSVKETDKTSFWTKCLNWLFDCPMPVVLNRGRHPGGVKKFPGSASRYKLYKMESFWTEMCPFQMLHQCYFYAAACYSV